MHSDRRTHENGVVTCDRSFRIGQALPTGRTQVVVRLRSESCPSRHRDFRHTAPQVRYDKRQPWSTPRSDRPQPACMSLCAEKVGHEGDLFLIGRGCREHRDRSVPGRFRNIRILFVSGDFRRLRAIPFPEAELSSGGSMPPYRSEKKKESGITSNFFIFDNFIVDYCRSLRPSPLAKRHRPSTAADRLRYAKGAELSGAACQCTVRGDSPRVAGPQRPAGFPSR